MKILLVRLRSIGDVVFTTPIIRALRRRLPDARLSYVVEPAAAAVLDGNPHLNDVIVIPRSSGLARVRDDLLFGRRLRRERFDVAIDLHGGPRSAWLTWASGARRRIGYRIAGRTWMYTDVVHRAAGLAPRHSVLNQCDLVAPLGLEPCDPARDPLEMSNDPASRDRVDERLRAAGIGPDVPLVVVHVSSTNPFRRWPAERFAELAAGLVTRDAARRIILVAGPSEYAAAPAIMEAARARAGALGHAITAAEFELPELRALIARAAVYIGGDSGPLHVAATTRTPIVELLGPTLAERARPWRDPKWFAEVVDVGELPCRPCQQRRCVPGDFRCLTGIGAERVIEAAERAIRHRV